MRVTGSIRKICGQKTETKEKEARFLTLSRILGSLLLGFLRALESSAVEKLRRIPLQYRRR